MFANKFVRRVGVNAFQSKRMMSGNAAEALKEVAVWQKVTAGMVVLSTLLSVYCYVTYDHAHGRTGLAYQKIRNKPFPWTCSDCDLFDMGCWKECKAANA